MLPLKLATGTRALVARVCTYTTGLPDSKLTYASLAPSGDQDGEMMGSRERRATCGFCPSASATCSS
ncbi:hypothetical protein D3C81_2175580 [compost metagenome]